METLRDRFLSLCRSQDYPAAIAFQNEITKLLPGEPTPIEFETVCGLDISYDKYSPEIYAAATLFAYPSLALIEEVTVIDKTEFPYISGLLAFREGPAAISAVESLKRRPDLLLVDGQGIAHPRGAGIASMVGLFLDIPAIGSAKTRLVGKYDDPAPPKGASSDMVYRGKVVGKALRSRDKVSPIFVSPGYRVSLDRAVELVLSMCKSMRLPVPIRRAHELANIARKKGPPQK